MYKKILLALVFSFVAIALLISNINIINITAQETQQVAETFAKICGDGVGGAAMSFAPPEVTTAVKTFEIGECLTTFGLGCAESIVGGKIKAAVTGKMLEALLAAVPQVRAPLVTYNMVKGYINTGSNIKEGCLEVDKNGLVNEMDPFEISLDKEGNPQDISKLLIGESAAELPKEEKILAGNVKLRKLEGKPFLLEAEKGKNSVVIIDGKKANLEKGYIKIERTENKEGKIGTEVKEADLVIGKGGGVLKFGEYEGKFKEGTHVLWNPEEGFSFPSGQKNTFVELVNPEGERVSLTLKEDEAYAKVVQGVYQIKGKNFEVDGIKVYGSMYPTGQQAQATLIVREKDKLYHKGRNTIVEINGLRIGGETAKEEIDIRFSPLAVFYEEDHISINERNIVIRTRKGGIDIEFLEGNPYIEPKGKLRITTEEGADSKVFIETQEPFPRIAVNVDKYITLENGLQKVELGDEINSVYIKNEFRRVSLDDPERQFLSTPLEIDTVDVIPIVETTEGSKVELSPNIRRYVVSISGTTMTEVSKCNYPEAEGITGHGILEELGEAGRSCITAFKGFFGLDRAEKRDDGVHVICKGEDYKATSIEGKEGIEYKVEEQNIRDFFNEKGEKVAMQVRDIETGEWGKKTYYEEVEVKEEKKEVEAPPEEKEVEETGKLEWKEIPALHYEGIEYLKKVRSKYAELYKEIGKKVRK